MKPATPLPWTISKYGQISENGADEPLSVAGGVSIPGGTHNPQVKVAKENAAYIVHACNAYPELVAALRASLDMYAPFQEQDDAEQGANHGADVLRTARALLARLGEDK